MSGFSLICSYVDILATGFPRIELTLERKNSWIWLLKVFAFNLSLRHESGVATTAAITRGAVKYVSNLFQFDGQH